MANSIIKWCKSKLLNGYKHINVVACEESSSGCRSDTETLVRGPDDFPLTSPRPEAPPTRTTFVEDIAGLVKTIYDAVGNSLSLSPSGSRTIKVKLTVTPEVARSNKLASPKIPHSPQPNDADDEEEQITPRRSYHRKKRKSMSFQRQELLQIIQANMEKNNLFYDSFHKRHDQRRRRNRHCSCSHAPRDLMKVRLQQDTECPCHSHHVHTHNYSGYNRCRHRSRSHDLSCESPTHVFRYPLLEKTWDVLPPSNTPEKIPFSPNLTPRSTGYYNKQLRHHRSRSCDAEPTKKDPSKQMHSPDMNLRYSKIHKEADHARTMAQVVSWLEKGNLLRDSSERTKRCGHTHHVHHHYHHYSESPPPLHI